MLREKTSMMAPTRSVSGVMSWSFMRLRKRPGASPLLRTVGSTISTVSSSR
jgi:hypothetical protein